MPSQVLFLVNVSLSAVYHLGQLPQISSELADETVIGKNKHKYFSKIVMSSLPNPSHM